MKKPRRKPLLGRFAVIVVSTLILPVIALTIILDYRLHDVYHNRIEETLRASKSSFLGRIDIESRELSTRAATIMADSRLLVLLRDMDLDQSNYAKNLDLLSHQVDFSLSWFSPSLKRSVLVGQGILSDAEIRSLVMEMAPFAPAMRVMVDGQGLFLVHVSVDQPTPKPRGYLVMQRRVSQIDLEVLQISLGQDVKILDNQSGRVLFSTARAESNPANQLAEIEKPWESAPMDHVIAKSEANRTVYSIWFRIPQDQGFPLVAEISIPDKAILAMDTARSFVTIAIGVILLIILSSILLTRGVISPILSLSYAVESMRKHISNSGPLVAIPVRENNEVGDLARAINGLGQELRRSVEKIEEQRAEIVAYTHSLEERVQERTRELEDARLRAELASQHKSKFLVNMNHELRTPLNSIAGITDLLRFGAYEKHEEIAAEFSVMWSALLEAEDMPLDIVLLLENLATGLVNETSGLRLVVRYLRERLSAAGVALDNDLNRRLDHIQQLADEEERQVFKAYNSIRDAGESLLGIIDEVINLSRIESGVITISPQPVNIADLVNVCMTHAESYARSKRKLNQLNFSRTIEESVPSLAMLDGQKVKQVLLNLLTNAVKYTEQGYIHCRVGLVAEAGKTFLHCSVQDSGRGIADKDRDVLFIEFGRVFEVREIEGSGLGLALSRKLIERHGGRMGFDSHEGAGSTFWFTLPMVLPES